MSCGLNLSLRDDTHKQARDIFQREKWINPMTDWLMGRYFLMGQVDLVVAARRSRKCLQSFSKFDLNRVVDIDGVFQHLIFLTFQCLFVLKINPCFKYVSWIPSGYVTQHVCIHFCLLHAFNCFFSKEGYLISRMEESDSPPQTSSSPCLHLLFTAVARDGVNWVNPMTRKQIEWNRLHKGF